MHQSVIHSRRIIELLLLSQVHEFTTQGDGCLRRVSIDWYDAILGAQRARRNGPGVQYTNQYNKPMFSD